MCYLQAEAGKQQNYRRVHQANKKHFARASFHFLGLFPERPVAFSRFVPGTGTLQIGRKAAADQH